MQTVHETLAMRIRVRTLLHMQSVYTIQSITHLLDKQVSIRTSKYVGF
jgi:hypothetical protein